jgi:two-component system cell cycle sensor histidine kinase/response regulator CckA
MPTRPEALTESAVAGRASAPPASLAALVEALPFAVAVFDAELELAASNERYRELTGLGAGQALKRPIRTAFPNALADLSEQIDAAATGAAPPSVRVGFRRGTGERLVDVTFAPLAAGPGAGVVFAGVDVTERDEWREARMAAVRQLASGILHDINNVLNPIMAAAYLLRAHADDPAAVRDYTERIATAVEIGAATAARVGRFIRQEPLQGIGSEELVDLSAIADEVVRMTRPSWAERATGGPIAFRDDLQPGALVRGIAGELRAAVLNLVQNALDAMAATGGTLGLRTRVAGDTAVLEVSDTGGGMPPEVRDRVFEPFFSTKGRGSAGLGLSEVYGIAKRHDGRAEIDTTPGAGTIVRLVFPLAVRPAGTGAQRPRATGGGRTFTT